MEVVFVFGKVIFNVGDIRKYDFSVIWINFDWDVGKFFVIIKLIFNMY